MIWNAEADAVLASMASEHTATEIGARLGVSRNAVLGRAHRQGLSLYHPNKERRSHMGSIAPVGGRKGKKLPAGHPALRGRPYGSAAFTLRQRGGAVAALMAGASYRLAAEMVGASKVTVDKQWRHNPAVRAEAEVIYRAAYADAKARADERKRLLDLQRNAAMTHNRRILAEWGDRNRTIVLRRCTGETLSAIGGDYNLTRERIRQICNRAIAQGLLAPPGVNLLNDRSFVEAV